MSDIKTNNNKNKELNNTGFCDNEYCRPVMDCSPPSSPSPRCGCCARGRCLTCARATQFAARSLLLHPPRATPAASEGTQATPRHCTTTSPAFPARWRRPLAAGARRFRMEAASTPSPPAPGTTSPRTTPPASRAASCEPT